MQTTLQQKSILWQGGLEKPVMPSNRFGFELAHDYIADNTEASFRKDLTT